MIRARVRIAGSLANYAIVTIPSGKNYAPTAAAMSIIASVIKRRCEVEHGEERNGGVYPLVCVVCRQAVGVLNREAFTRMVVEGEAYICKSCMTEKPSEEIEAQLEMDDPAGTEVSLFHTLTLFHMISTQRPVSDNRLQIGGAL